MTPAVEPRSVYPTRGATGHVPGARESPLAPTKEVLDAIDDPWPSATEIDGSNGRDSSAASATVTITHPSKRSTGLTRPKSHGDVNTAVSGDRRVRDHRLGRRAQQRPSVPAHRKHPAGRSGDRRPCRPAEQRNASRHTPNYVWRTIWRTRQQLRAVHSSLAPDRALRRSARAGTSDCRGGGPAHGAGGRGDGERSASRCRDNCRCRWRHAFPRSRYRTSGTVQPAPRRQHHRLPNARVLSRRLLFVDNLDAIALALVVNESVDLRRGGARDQTRYFVDSQDRRDCR